MNPSDRTTPIGSSYVVIFSDRWDDSSISFTLGPYDNLHDAQAAARRAMEKISGGYRQHSIYKCRSISQIPEREIE